LDRGHGPPAFYEEFKQADDAKKDELLRAYIGEELKKDAGIKAAQERLQSESAIVPVALDLGMSLLQRAQQSTDLDERRSDLENAEKTFLAIGPFSMRELMARVKAQLRRTRLLTDELGKKGPTPTQQSKLTFKDLVINLTRREVTLHGDPIKLKPKEYELLEFFAEHKEQMLSREFILERVWGWDFIGDSRTVDVHVRWLRQKIEEDSSNPTRIITVRGGGYRFEG
jgi:DNA-binding winged helix-turn-helix (wHTH) protein